LPWFVDELHRIAVGSGVAGNEKLVGRDEEAQALLGFLQARDSLPATAVVAGAAGIGKTTLWLAGVEAAGEFGYRVLACRPSEAETRFSFAGLTDLIGDVVEPVLPELPPVQARALEAALLLTDSTARADDRVIAAAFLSALKALSGSGALLVAVDDLQWLDGPSVATLRFALPRLRTEPVAVLLAVRGEFPSWPWHGVTEERSVTMELGGLSLAATHELLQARLGRAFARPLLRRIWEASGGNPFFALELARALQRRGGSVEPGGELPLPATLDELVRERISELSPSALEVSRVVAAVADATVSLVEAAVGPAAESGLADALESKVLELDGERLRFTHPLLASSISSRITPARRRSLHTRLADLVPTLEERARHLALATTRPSREVASVLEDAGRNAHVRGAPAAAAELSEQALRLTPIADVDDTSRRRLIAAARHFEAGDSGRAITLFDQARAAAAPGAERAGVLVQLGPVTKYFRGPREAVAVYREALVEAEGDDELGAIIHLSLAELARFSEGGVDVGLEHAALALRAASRVGDATLRCRALAAHGLLRFNAGEGIPRAEMDEALTLERALPEWPLMDGPTNAIAYQLWSSGDLESARRVLHEYREALRARSDPEEAVALWHLTFLEWRAGNWELAAQHLADSLSLTTQAGRMAMWPAQEAPATAIAAHQGRIDEARDQAEHAAAEAAEAGIPVAESGHRWVLGFIELSLGNAAAALEHLRRSLEIRDMFVREPGMRLELADTLEALIAVGELDEAERILIPWEERASLLDRAWALAWLARCRGLLLAARGDLQGAFGAFDRALAEHARSTDPFHHARTLLALGVTQRRSKRRGLARTTLEEAREIFERLGAPLWADRAQAELARIGGRVPSRGELTEGERRIALLAAEGHTNREVAMELSLTVHTVETVLSRTYRKLGVRSRAELAHRLGRNTGEARAANS
jgi:DNA-binding CsgD family transcriptional regulator